MMSNRSKGNAVKSDIKKDAVLSSPQYWSVHVAKVSKLNEWVKPGSLSVYSKSGNGVSDGISMPFPSRQSSVYVSIKSLEWTSSLMLIF